MISLCWFAVVFADFGIFARTCCMLGRFVFRYAPMRHSQVFPPQVVKLSAVKNYTISFFADFNWFLGRFTDLLKCWLFLNLTAGWGVFFSKNAYPTKTQSADFWYMGGTCCVPAQDIPFWNFGRDSLISAVFSRLVKIFAWHSLLRRF